MEVNNHELGESRMPASIPTPEAATLDIIRTETVLSRLPVHNLAKKGSISIQILKKTDDGEVELLWRVSPSRDYGEPRQLAYKLDTIIINQRIDEAGRPLPKLLRLGSLNDICEELGLTTDHGTNAKNIKNAFLQNALTGITAKFNYRANDGTERRLEAGFTRYSVIFTGEKLPDGRKADAVYIVFNDPFWEVLNNAPVRPLDRAYMKELPPAAQRFYEIISRKIFAALKNNYPRAKISYSEYCTFSAQLRHYERQRVQDQMAKLLRHHKESGYITSVSYVPTIDAENQPDWIMYFTPGPKAHAEFAAAHRTRKHIDPNTDAIERGEQQPRRDRSRASAQRLKQPVPQPVQFDPELVSEFTRRGVTESKARAILANVKPNQPVLAQLELGDHHIATNPGKYRNPAGFYIHVVEENSPIPADFETSSQRKAREKREEEQRRVEDDRRAQQDLETEYYWYSEDAIERYIAALDPAEVAAVRELKWQEQRAKYQTMSSGLIDSFADQETKRELGRRAPLFTIEEFKAKREQGTVFLSQPVPESPSADELPAEPAVALASAEIVAERAPEDTLPDSSAPTEERGEAIEQKPEPANPPEIPEEPAIELVSTAPPEAANPPPMSEPPIELLPELPRQEPGTGPVEQGLV
jgi:hypothetical protein